MSKDPEMWAWAVVGVGMPRGMPHSPGGATSPHSMGYKRVTAHWAGVGKDTDPISQREEVKVMVCDMLPVVWGMLCGHLGK